MILDTLRESRGCAVAVDENQICEWIHLTASCEGLSRGLEAATCIGGAELLADSGWIQSGERAIIYNSGASQKYPVVLRVDLLRINMKAPLDWEQIAAGR